MAANSPTADSSPPAHQPLRVCFVGGGTGGHLYPCLAVAEHLRQAQPSTEVLFLGARRGLDRPILEREGLPYELISARPLPYGLSPALPLAAFGLAVGVVQAGQALGRFQPDVVFTTGGYVAASALPAAWMLNVPIVLHDSDALTGRANRLLARLASAVTVAFESAKERLAAYQPVLTGQPVRLPVRGADRGQAARALGVSPEARTLLVTGGSRGARSLNRALLGALGKILTWPDVQVLHLCGEAAGDQVSAELRQRGIEPAPPYHLWPYLHDIPSALACADLVVCRAGSNTVAELAARGLPAIIVPYPHAAAHQEANARPLVEAGAAVLVRDEELTPEALLEHVSAILLNEEKRRTMAAAARSVDHPDAGAEIAAILVQCASRADHKAANRQVAPDV